MMSRKTYAIRAALLALMVNLAFVLALDYAIRSAHVPRAPVACETDAECAALCPADDLQCDGGPQ